MGDTIIKVENLGKRYRIQHQARWVDLQPRFFVHRYLLNGIS